MKCILIFDNLNDILYIKCDKKFSRHVKKLGRLQGFISEGREDDEFSPNVIIQLFSPIVTSQKIMNCQFGNSYSSVQCQDGTKMVFDEYMGYLFVHIGIRDVEWLKRMLGVCITMVKHLCGPDVSILKSNRSRAMQMSRLLDTWFRLQDSDQAVLVESVEQLMVNSDLSAATMRALQDATEKLKAQTDFSKIHAMVLVENKFLSLYSSRNAQELSPADILFLSLLCESLRPQPPDVNLVDSTESEAESSDEFYSPQSSPQDSPASLRRQQQQPPERLASMDSLVVLLMGDANNYGPHVVHIAPLEDGVNLLVLFEMGNVSVSSGLAEAFSAVNLVQNMQLQRDMEGIRAAFESLDGGIKRASRICGLPPEAESSQRRLQARWEPMRRRYVELLRTSDPECLLRLESGAAGLVDCLKELLRTSCMDATPLSHGRLAVLSLAGSIRLRLADFSDFLKVKALRNFTLGASLTINKYLEEFPGLVHFLYIDRSTHRITAPSLDFTSEETISLTKKKIWSMVELTRTHLQEGHFAIMWKDTTFNYAYFLWFEDASGSPLKPKVSPTTILKSFPRPGILCGDFYQKLVEACFPKVSRNKVRCFELYCIHLGLATSSCVLEHSRRLAATIWEVTGLPNNAMDLL